jgi:hypothetical protein
MAGLEAPWELMGSSPERGRRRGAGGTPGEGEGCRAMGVVARSSWLPLRALCYMLYAGRRKEQKEEERGGKRKGRKRKKKKNYGKIFKLENF